MTNVTLFISVLICFICHCFITNNILLNIKIGIILLLYFYGLLTSFLNHGTKNQKYKQLDRISMRLLFIVNLILLTIIYYKNNNYINIIICLYVMLILSGLFYYCSKTYDVKTIGNLFHICSHISITFVNTFILYLF